jgi:hypothetical protein
MDQVGGVHALTNESETVAKTYEFGPYGSMLAESGSAPNDFVFPATYLKLADVPELRLSPRRVYDADTRRYLQRDQKAPVPTYTYCLSDLGKCVDPSGLEVVKIANDLEVITGTLTDLRAHGKKLLAAQKLQSAAEKYGMGSERYKRVLHEIKVGAGEAGLKDILKLVEAGGKFLELHEKVQMLADVISGDEEAKVKVAEKLGNELVEKLLSMTPLGKVGAKLILGLAKDASALGAWIAQKVGEINTARACVCCLLSQTSSPKRNYETWKTREGYECYTAGKALYVKVAKPKSTQEDGFFGTLYRIMTKPVTKAYVKCPHGVSEVRR